MIKKVISDKEEQSKKKPDPPKCPTHLFIVSNKRQRIEVKPAKTANSN